MIDSKSSKSVSSNEESTMMMLVDTFIIAINAVTIYFITKLEETSGCQQSCTKGLGEEYTFRRNFIYNYSVFKICFVLISMFIPVVSQNEVLLFIISIASVFNFFYLYTYIRKVRSDAECRGCLKDGSTQEVSDFLYFLTNLQALMFIMIVASSFSTILKVLKLPKYKVKSDKKGKNSKNSNNSSNSNNSQSKKK
mgnify:CR=1 FL=1|tara:strand:- start:1762 stop:2346 length:585 start_codon:yes stop_codon:yes gene_type:complete